MDYKWHDKFIVEIISESGKGGIGKSYLVRKGWRDVNQRDYAILSRIGFHDALLLDEHEVEYYLNNVAFVIAEAVWESEGKPKDTDMHIRALRVDMDSLSNRFKIYTDIKLDMDKHRKS
ncbi:phage protein [Pseudomonas phage PA02]|nr:phage protein [Pseudomonas phage PA02]